jgi:hypothetical protein
MHKRRPRFFLSTNKFNLKVCSAPKAEEEAKVINQPSINSLYRLLLGLVSMSASCSTADLSSELGLYDWEIISGLTNQIEHNRLSLSLSLSHSIRWFCHSNQAIFCCNLFILDSLVFLLKTTVELDSPPEL